MLTPPDKEVLLRLPLLLLRFVISEGEAEHEADDDGYENVDHNGYFFCSVQI